MSVTFEVMFSRDGAYERIERCAQVNQQRREARQAASIAAAVLEGHRPLPDGDDEAWLHWRVRNRRRSSSRQNSRQSHRKTQQMRRHIAAVRRPHQRHRTVDQ